MAKLTKKQEAQCKALISLHHEVIRAKHANNRKDYEEAIVKIRETVKEEENVDTKE